MKKIPLWLMAAIVVALVTACVLFVKANHGQIALAVLVVFVAIVYFRFRYWQVVNVLPGFINYYERYVTPNGGLRYRQLYGLRSGWWFVLFHRRVELAGRIASDASYPMSLFWGREDDRSWIVQVAYSRVNALKFFEFITNAEPAVPIDDIGLADSVALAKAVNELWFQEIKKFSIGTPLEAMFSQFQVTMLNSCGLWVRPY